jgi:hypothetical protein
MGRVADTIDEIDESARPLVVVPQSATVKIVQSMIPIICVTVPLLLVGFVAYSSLRDPWMRPAMIVPLTLVLLANLTVLTNSVVQARRPRLVIGKQGLQIGQSANPHGSDFEWNEVSYCHWSHFEPGVLNIQVHGGPALAEPLPPMRHFVSVPEPYRARVEKAIRAMGKWADDLTDLAPVPASSQVVSSSVKATSIDEIDAGTVPLVEIWQAHWKTVLGALGAFTLAAYVLLLCGTTLLSAGSGSSRLLPDALLVLIAAGLFGFAVPYWARSPEFSVSKDGIRLPVSRRRVNAPPFVRVDLGLFAWDEVSYCRWSRFEPGLLQVQVNETRSQHQVKLAPMRLFYLVPAAYRARVEKAVRAMGKWAE